MITASIKGMARRTTGVAAALIVSMSLAANPIEGLLNRIDKGAAEKFVIELQEGSSDFFELDQQGSKVVVRGNSYISIGVGINWYLKYYCGIHLAWNNMSAPLPCPLPAVQRRERHTTDLTLRYDFNYCTFSYSMPFWDWERWQQEIDWMVLHGINIPLAAVGQECVWRRLLLQLGYTCEQVEQFIAGPAFLAWWAMNNLEGWGGPNPTSWYARQESLQRQILARMREYGMSPVLPGYVGMVPHDADATLQLNITPAGTWNGYCRPAFLSPTDERFAAIAALYYDIQRDLFGVADYYSMDPFHEAGDAQEVDFAAAGQALLRAMKRANSEAVWVVQGWTENPRQEMLDSVPAGDILVLDLFSECRPMWGIPSLWQRKDGYGQHGWLFCMLENFGANVGLHGRLDQLLSYFYATRSNPLAQHIKGIGLTMEGIENNPVMYELMCELPWRSEQIDKEQWLADYAAARYGRRDSTLAAAWHILGNSIYNCPEGNNQQGPTESIFCCRPSLRAYQASSWSKMEDYYAASSTEQAARLFLSVAEQYRGNNNYEYDLVDIVRQAIADHAREVYRAAITAYERRQRAAYDAATSDFLRLLLLQDELLSTQPAFSVGRWLAAARAAGTTPDESDQYEWNARVQITTWGNRRAADEGGLRDYAHKEWNGLLKDFYYPRWAAFFAMLARCWDAGQEAEDIDFYGMEEPWTRDHTPYPSAAAADCVGTAQRVFAAVFGDSNTH